MLKIFIFLNFYFFYMPKPKSEEWFNQIRNNIRDTFQNITTEILEVFEERPSYVQMRLSVDRGASFGLC